MRRVTAMIAATVSAGAGVSYFTIQRMKDPTPEAIDLLRGVIVFQGIVYATISIFAVVQAAKRIRSGAREVCIPARPLIANFLFTTLLVYYGSIEMIRLIVVSGPFAWWRSPVLFVATLLADIWLFGLLATFFPSASPAKR